MALASSTRIATPVAKRARTEAQKAAFANMIAVRDKQVYEKMKQADVPAEPTPVQADETPQLMPTKRAQMPEAFITATRLPAQTSPSDLMDEELPVQQQRHQQDQQQDFCGEDGGYEDDDNVEFVDVDELMQNLHSTRSELASLKEQVGNLVSQHGELSSSFRQHHLRMKDEIYFV